MTNDSAPSYIHAGQGLYTKVAQVAALTLGLEDTSLIEVQSTSTNTVPNGGGTGGSTTSGKNCAGAATTVLPRVSL